MQIIPFTINYWLVGASILIAGIASYTAFGFTERLASSKGRAYAWWLAGGSSALGLGIWSMHYLGMLAVQLPIEVFYHVPTVALSLVLAVLASAVVLRIISRKNLRPIDIVIGSLLMGAGIGGMHYVGMHAMRSSAMHRYDVRVVLLSVAVAVGFSWVALQISLAIGRRAEVREWRRMAGAAIMGLGISAMHYTAMAAVTFQGDGMLYSTQYTIRVSTVGVAAIVFTATVVLIGSFITTLLDRRGYERLKSVLEQLSEERDRFSAAAESSMDALHICSALRGETGEIEDFVFTYLNTNMEKMVAIPRELLLGQKMSQILPLNLSLGLFDRYKHVVLTGEALAYEYTPGGDDLAAQWFRIQAVKVRDGVAITMSDITNRKLQEEQILRLAHHDPLTGLLNRSLLLDRMSQAVNRADRYRGKAAVYLVDLDKFKDINDTLGHAAGDTVLITVAHRLREVVRASDTIIRIGGDEFVVIIGELKQHADAQACGEKLVEAFRRPILVGKDPLTVTCSVGGVVYPDSHVAPDDLLLKADLALYTAKEQGKNRYHIYSETEPVPPVKLEALVEEK